MIRHKRDDIPRLAQELKPYIAGWTRAGSTAVTSGGGGAAEPTPSKQYTTFVVAANNSTDDGKAAADYVCDGTTDNVEISAALTATTTSGYRRVLLLEGTYNVVVGSIVISSAGTTLEGQGDGTVLVCTSNGVGTKIIAVTAADVHIKNLRFNISGASSTGAAIKATSADRFVAENVHIRAPSAGIWLLTSLYGRVSNCHFYNYGSAIIFDQSDHSTAIGNILYGNNTGEGVRSDNSDYLTITGNNILGTGTASAAAIEINNSASTGQVIANNTIDGFDIGIQVSSTYTQVSNNLIYGSDQGIRLWGNSCTATGNVIIRTAGTTSIGYGIYVESYHHIVSNNYIEGHMGGISIDISIECVVTGNYIIGNSWTTTPAADETPGIFIWDNCERIFVADNVIRKATFSSGSTSTYVQSYGVYIDNSTDIDCTVIDNDLRNSGATGDIFDAGTRTLYRAHDGSTKMKTLTIATGVITVPGNGYSALLPQTGTADDLDTISGGKDGMVIYVRNSSATNTITLKHGTGNLSITADVVLNAINTVQPLIYDAAQVKWLKV